MRPHLRQWHEAVRRVDPKRVGWEHPAAGLPKDLLALGPRTNCIATQEAGACSGEVGEGAHCLFEVRLVNSDAFWCPVSVIVLEVASHDPERIELVTGQ